MSHKTIPSLAEFLTAPIEEVAKVAPLTMIYGAGGTRRRAVFEGVEPWSDEFVIWARKHIFRCIHLIFQHGIRNLIVNVLTSDNFREVNRYQDRLIERAKWVVAGNESIHDYQHWSWKVRFLGTENLPELKATASSLYELTPQESTSTLYWTIVSDEESPWLALSAAAQRSQARTRSELVCALYGEDIPPATLYLGFGKPTLLPEIAPPLLMGQIQSYWSQQPGYTLTATQLRTILYDYAYLRPTWQEEKLERPKEALAYRSVWENGPILGLGMRLGPFWYPAPMSSSAWPTE